MMLNEFSTLVRQARTHRLYINADTVSRDALIKLIDVARNVPSGLNVQPLRYRIVTDTAECAAVYACTNWAGGLRTGPAPTPEQRPNAWIVIVSVPTQISPAVDVGIAAQTINLAAAAAGYATCMLGAIDRDKIHQLLKLPSDTKIELLMSVGKAGEKVSLEDFGPGVQMPYWRTPDQVHHVAKRKLADVLIG